MSTPHLLAAFIIRVCLAGATLSALGGCYARAEPVYVGPRHGHYRHYDHDHRHHDDHDHYH